MNESKLIFIAIFDWYIATDELGNLHVSSKNSKQTEKIFKRKLHCVYFQLKPMNIQKKIAIYNCE